MNLNLYFIPYIKSKLRAGGVAQVVECLPCKCEALTSKPSNTKKKCKLKMGHIPGVSS
jgi:hypothetical protein